LSCGGMAHGTLPPGRTSLAIRHRTVAEIWFVLGGTAEIWRRLGDIESVETVLPGQSLTIPTGTEFQFRTAGPEPFTFIMCTMPPWPGSEEAMFIEGKWKASDDAL
jgi:mannose-6-phosphate isomerase-like protein (cupin superfamily)